MSMSQERAELIAKLEDIAAEWVYNKRNNYGKGGFYHYPVAYKDPRYNNSLFDGKDYYPVTPETIESLRYEFGANKYFIGNALDAILDYLEKRYNIDFDALEDERYGSYDDQLRSRNSNTVTTVSRISNAVEQNKNHPVLIRVDKNSDYFSG